MSNRKVFVAVHAGFGAGKSWLAHTAPGPRLVLDTENGSLDVAHEGMVRVEWKLGSQALKDVVVPHDNTSVYVDAPTPDLLLKAVKYLETASDHPFDTLVLDSFTETQKQTKRTVARVGGEYDPNALFDQQAWGRLFNNGELLMARLRDLTRPASTPKPVNVVLVLPSDIESVPIRPLLQGGLRKHFAGYPDMLGYLVTGETPDGEEAWALHIRPTEMYEAKARLHAIKAKYGPTIINPNLSEMFAVVNQEV